MSQTIGDTAMLLSPPTASQVVCYYAHSGVAARGGRGDQNKCSSFFNLLHFAQNLFCSLYFVIDHVFRFLFEYVFKVSIWDLLFCFRGTHGRRKFLRALEVWVVLLLAIIYGVFQALRNYRWDTTGFLGSESDWLTIIARASGKLTTLFAMLGLLFPMRSVSSALNEVPQYKRNNIGWRRIHVHMFVLCMMTAAIHSICQALRMRCCHTNWVYEEYFIATGVLLWVLFSVQGLPYLSLSTFSSGSAENSISHGWTMFWKWMFRKLHIAFYLPIVCVYVVHSASFFPIAFYLSWRYLNNQSTFHIMHAWYRKNEDDNSVSLIIQVTAKIPFDFGYYCQIEAAGISASYTMVPLARIDPRVNSMYFMIKESILSEALLRRLNSVRKLHRDEEYTQDFDGTTYNRIPVSGVDLQVTGPYHSTDLSIRDSSSKRLVVMTADNGSSVAESVIKFSLKKQGYWERVISLHLCGGKAPTDELVKRRKFSDCADPLPLTFPAAFILNPASASPGSTASALGNAATSSAAPVGTTTTTTTSAAPDGTTTSSAAPDGTTTSSAVPVDTSTSQTDVDVEQYWNQVWRHASDKSDNLESTRAYQIWGYLQSNLVRDLIEQMDDGETHFLICSDKWYKLVEQADKVGGSFTGELWTRIHNEEFSPNS